LIEIEARNEALTAVVMKLSSGIERHVVRSKLTDISEEYVASIFRIEE
jgi:hypothetical protein